MNLGGKCGNKKEKVIAKWLKSTAKIVFINTNKKLERTKIVWKLREKKKIEKIRQHETCQITFHIRFFPVFQPISYFSLYYSMFSQPFPSVRRCSHFEFFQHCSTFSNIAYFYYSPSHFLQFFLHFPNVSQCPLIIYQPFLLPSHVFFELPPFPTKSYFFFEYYTSSFS